MVRFVLNQTIETAETTIAVDPGLSPGRHRFRLVVIDDAGKRSQPVEAIVEIKGEIVPPALPTDLPASPVRPAVDSSLRATIGVTAGSRGVPHSDGEEVSSVPAAPRAKRGGKVRPSPAKKPRRPRRKE